MEDIVLTKFPLQFQVSRQHSIMSHIKINESEEKDHSPTGSSFTLRAMYPSQDMVGKQSADKF